MPEPKPELLNRIIIELNHGHWSAWFDGRPQIAFGGDSPGTAVDRLWGNVLENLDAMAGTYDA